MSNEASVVKQVKVSLANDATKKKFEEILGKKASQYMASIVNAVSNNEMLKQCEPNSIVGAAFVAATYDLPIDSNLGFAAMVPYRDGKTKVYNAQFQMMYKGFVQLAIRSGAYENMNVAEVYEDELVSYNPISGELELVKDFSECTQRSNGDKNKIVGYCAWFRLLSGFKKELYMTRKECENHALQYSASYKNDTQRGWNSSKWSTDFDAMAKKTVLKLLLSRWGVLNIEMQNAITDDQKVYTQIDEAEYVDNDSNDVQDPFANIEDKETEEAVTDESKGE